MANNEALSQLSSKNLRTIFTLILATAGIFLIQSSAIYAETDNLISKAQAIHERVITLDTHVDISVDNFTPEKNYLDNLDTQVDLPSMDSGGLDAAFFVVYVGQGPLTQEGYENAYRAAMDKFEAIHWMTSELAPQRIGLALTPRDVREIAESGRKVALIGVENAYPLGLDLGNIRRFAERGARYMSLAHNGHSQFSDSNTGEIREGGMRYGGLSDLGRKAVEELNRWGVMIDLSHPSKAATLQTMKLSRAPVIASHSSARGLEENPRNMDDEQLMALKSNGGVIQAVAFRSYLNAEKHSAWQTEYDEIAKEIGTEMGIKIVSERREVLMMQPEQRSKYLESIRPVIKRANELAPNISAPQVDVADFVNHIDYLVNKIGIDHVGISSDFDGGGGILGWNDADETFNVTLELVRRGYSETEIEKLWSANLLRVMDIAQAVALTIQRENEVPDVSRR